MLYLHLLNIIVLAKESKKPPDVRKWALEKVRGQLAKIELVVKAILFFLGTVLNQKYVWNYWKPVLVDNDDIIERTFLTDSWLEVKIADAILPKSTEILSKIARIPIGISKSIMHIIYTNNNFAYAQLLDFMNTKKTCKNHPIVENMDYLYV